MRRGEITLYATLLALALLIFVSTWFSIRTQEKVNLPPTAVLLPSSNISCPKEVVTYKMELINPSEKEVYARVQLIPDTNITAISVDAEPLITLLPNSKKVFHVYINTTLPRGDYTFGYRVYFYISDKNGTKVLERSLRGYLRVVSCFKK